MCFAARHKVLIYNVLLVLTFLTEPKIRNFLKMKLIFLRGTNKAKANKNQQKCAFCILVNIAEKTWRNANGRSTTLPFYIFLSA